MKHKLCTASVSAPTSPSNEKFWVHACSSVCLKYDYDIVFSGRYGLLSDLRPAQKLQYLREQNEVYCILRSVSLSCHVVWEQRYRSDEIMCNANLMQQGNFINVFLARHVSGIYAHHQEH